MLRRPTHLQARLFRAALRVAPAHRAAFLERACRGDLAAKAEVAADLAAAALQDDRFDRPAGLTTVLGDAVPPSGRFDPASLLHLRMGRYVLERELGRGASGAVYLALDVDGELAPRALKVFVCRTEPEQQAVRREVAVLRGLAVPGVVPILDDGEDGPYAWVAMPVVDGAPFPGPRRGFAALRRPAIGLLEAVARIHDLGVVHRDLKPRNVLVDAEGLVTLLDVGASGGPEGAVPDAALAGTFEWMAPEQRRGVTDRRSDLHACALLVACALAGATPDALRARGPGGERLPPVATLAPDVPPGVAALLDRCLAPDPEVRPADAHEVLEALGEELDTAALHAALVAEAHDGRVRAATLERWFAGPVPIHHLPDDAAREVLRRTDGDPRAVAAELASWVRAGTARRDGSRFVVTRAALDRLAQSEATVRRAADGPRPAPPDAADAALAFAASAAGPDPRPDVLARALGRTPDDVAAALDRLVAEGRLHRHGDRWSRAAGTDAGLASAARDALRRRLVAALPPGAPARLWNLLLLADPPPAAVADEATARDRADAGARLAGLQAAARFLRGQAREAERREIVLLDLVSAAIGSNDLAEVRAAGREVDLAPPTPALTAIRGVARAAAWSMTGEPRRALATLELLDDADPYVGRELHRVRVRVAYQLPLDVETRMLDGARTWARAHPGALPPHVVQQWEGYPLYRRFRFREGARAHEAAAALAPSPAFRVQAWAEAAACWVEAYAHGQEADGEPPDALLDRAAAAVAAGWDALGARRVAVHELLLRNAERRIAHARDALRVRPDPAAVEALGVGLDPRLAIVGLVAEAALAWRHGDLALVRRAAAMAEAACRGLFPPGLVIARGLGALAGGPAVGADRAALLAAARGAAAPGLRAQGLALLAAADPDVADAVRDDVVAAARQVPSRAWGRRREVLSLDECLRYVDRPAPRPGRRAGGMS